MLIIIHSFHVEAIQTSSRIHLWYFSYQRFLSGQFSVQLYLTLLCSVSLRDISNKLLLYNFLRARNRRNNLVCLTLICVHNLEFSALLYLVAKYKMSLGLSLVCLIKKNWKQDKYTL